MKTRRLALKQLDIQLEPWFQAKNFFQPRKGWVNCLRKMLGMTLPQLANRLGVARSRVIKIQQAELSGSITMHTLIETANALHCDLIYALVPRKPLQTLLKDQAESIAKQRLERVSHSMLLEDQQIDASQQQEQFEELVRTLLSGSPKHLW